MLKRFAYIYINSRECETTAYCANGQAPQLEFRTYFQRWDDKMEVLGINQVHVNKTEGVIIAFVMQRVPH